ncbi:MAG: PQQ-binding-like beta-propeller repeat protein, partial [Opitutales bacterium]|nr:PQQ-binding-like beta-propeller repeat protein [Opitutales bacterium]
LYAINGKSGVKLWEFVTGARVFSSPAIGSDGTVYIGSVDKKVYAIKTDSKGLAKSPWPMRGQNAQHTGRAVVAADPPVANPEPEAPQKKLTPEEVEALLTDEIGTWQVKGHTLQQGIDVETGLAWKPKDSKFTMETRWKEKGKSTSSTFSPVINGKKVPYVATWKYDAKEGVFIWRSKGEGFPEAVENQRYDPEKKIFHGVTLHPNGAIETTTFKIVNQDKRLFSSHVRVDGRIVFSREEVFTRLEEKPEDNALAAFIPNKAIHVEMNGQKIWFRFKNDGFVTIEDESGDTIPMNYMVRGLRVTIRKGSGEMVFTFQKPKVSAGDKLILTIDKGSEGGEARVIEVIATRKLTKEEVADLFAGDIGKWKLTGKSVSEGGTPEPFENIVERNWKVEGQSTLARSNLSINGKEVPFTWHKEYNAKEGVFIVRSKGEGFPETVIRERYDPEKKIYHGQATYPDGAKETTTYGIINKDKRIFKMQVEFEGRVVHSMEAVSKRMEEDHVDPGPETRPVPGSLEDNIRGKRIVFGQIGSKDGILQFNEDGTFKVGQLVWGPSVVSPQRIKFELDGQGQETATYKVSGLKVSVKADQEDNFITFKNNNPKKGDSIYVGNAPSPFRILRIGSEILYANEVSEIADQTHQQILNPQGVVNSKQKPGIWEISTKIQVKK